MKCPICNDVRMREVVKDNIMIDVCPDCKGVWLDRGELEKLLESERLADAAYDANYNPMSHTNEQQRQPYSQSQPPYGQVPPPGYQQSHPYPKHDKYKHDDKYKYDKYGRPYKKKKTVLDVFGDLFD
ncbi:zf-TFIIB domain-containing protein [Paenibacillus yanchengensis]|uniref:Zf-TFIIB domain-containing protein n=1 Tax=Paenibacillus yanchengensis TaxID=2035833 RepID=A0ABW4YL39_9BACL